MSIGQKIATIFGGTGFVGTQIVRELATRGIMVKVATRVPERAYFLKPCGNIGQIVPVFCNYNDATSIENAVAGSDYVVNCVGLLFEKGKHNRFKKAHIDTPAAIAQAAQKHGVKSLVHMSALGVDKSKSLYARTKYEGEIAVQKAFPNAVILRPSVIFGEGDNFFNMFARILPFMPFMPLIGGGETKFQPVYVGDVADAAVNALLDVNTAGEIFELGGANIYSFEDIYQLIFKYTGRQKPLVKIPFFVAKIQAFFLQALPCPLLTVDQVESLKTDNIVSGHTKGLADLGVQSVSVEMILPRYMTQYKSGGRFATDDADAAPSSS